MVPVGKLELTNHVTHEPHPSINTVGPDRTYSNARHGIKATCDYRETKVKGHFTPLQISISALARGHPELDNKITTWIKGMLGREQP